MAIFAYHHHCDSRYSLPHPLVRFSQTSSTYRLSSPSRLQRAAPLTPSTAVPIPLDCPSSSTTTVAMSSSAIVLYSHTHKHNTHLDSHYDLSLPSGAFLHVAQEYLADSRGGTVLGFGAAVYPAAVALALLLNSPWFSTLEFQGGIVELGCGPGLLGLATGVSWKQTPPPSTQYSVVVTDGDDKSVALANNNIEAHRGSLQSCTVAAKLLWGNDEQEASVVAAAGGRVGLVVMSDVAALVYKEFFPDLVKTIVNFCKRGAIGVMAYKRRDVRCEEVFFRLLKRSGVVIERGDEMLLEEDFRRSDGERIEVYLFRIIEN